MELNTSSSRFTFLSEQASAMKAGSNSTPLLPVAYAGGPCFFFSNVNALALVLAAVDSVCVYAGIKWGMHM